MLGSRSSVYLGIAAFAISVSFSVGASSLEAQSVRVAPIFAAGARACSCGRWICPLCQDGCTALPSFKAAGDLPALPYPLAGGEDATPRQPQIPPAPLPSPEVGEPAVNADALQPVTPDIQMGGGLDVGSFAATLGAVSGGVGVPGMIGDIFGGGSTRYILGSADVFMETATGFFESNGDPLGFGEDIFYVVGENQGTGFFSTGPGRDTNGDGFADTYDLQPPTETTSEFEGTATARAVPIESGELWDLRYALITRELTIHLPNPGSLVVGRLKIAENTSPIPRHRIFCNYSLFDDVPLIEGDVNVNRFTPGFERTFWHDQASIELRFPLAATLNSSIVADGPNDLSNIEFGDIFIAAKFLLLSTNAPHRRTDTSIRTRNAWDFSAGVSLAVPTADDLNVMLSDGTPLVRIENESVRVMPFLGWLGQAASGYFTQGFLQLDVDANGNSVSANFLNEGLLDVGRIQGPTFLYLDVGVGQTLPLSRYKCLQAITPILELHYNRSLQSEDFIQTGRFRVAQGKEAVQTLNMVVGNTFHFGRQTNATCAYATPIGNGSDHMFDGELRVLWNRFF